MGVFAEIAGELPEECLHDNLIFKYLINKKIEESTAKPTHEFYKFMNDIIPDIPPRRQYMYHMYVAESKQTYCDIKFNDKHDYIYALYKMSQFDCYNVFFSLTPYRYTRKLKRYATSVQGFFIDIDDLDFDVMSMSKEELIEFLADEYGVPMYLMPQTVCKSGHGIHLFYKLYEPFKNEPLREKYAQSLITYFKADFSSSRVTQNIRTPGSYNIKNNPPIKTEMFTINERSAFNLSDLDYFLKTQHEIDEHHNNDNIKKAAKSRATYEKNKALRIANGEPPKPRKPYKKRDKTNKATDHTKATEEKKEKIPLPVDISKMEYYHHFSRKARSWNLIMDLHNYFLRHNGDIYGMRANFFTIMATYCTHMMDEEECKNFLCDYADDEFQSELEEIVRYIYDNLSKGIRYTYRYEKIAKILCFTEEDIRMSYCSFSQERREEATKARKKRYAEKKKAETRYKKQDRVNYVREHFHLSNAELAEVCSVSERTISRIRATLRERGVA